MSLVLITCRLDLACHLGVGEPNGQADVILTSLSSRRSSIDFGYAAFECLLFPFTKSLPAGPSSYVSHNMSGKRARLRHYLVDFSRNGYSQWQKRLRKINRKGAEHRSDETGLSSPAWAYDGNATTVCHDSLKSRFRVLIAIEVVEGNVIEGQVLEEASSLKSPGRFQIEQSVVTHL